MVTLSSGGQRYEEGTVWEGVVLCVLLQFSFMLASLPLCLPVCLDSHGDNDDVDKDNDDNKDDGGGGGEGSGQTQGSEEGRGRGRWQVEVKARQLAQWERSVCVSVCA